jgi:hypothetical protein
MTRKGSRAMLSEEHNRAAVLATLQARHSENLRRFSSLENLTEKLDKKIDRLQNYVIVGLASTLVSFLASALHFTLVR